MRIKNKKLIVPAVLLALVLLFHFTPLGQGLYFLRYPLTAGGSFFHAAGAGVNSALAAFFGGARWRREAFEKEQALARALAENARLRFLDLENQELRGLLALKNDAPRTLVAEIIAFESLGNRHRMLINKGANDGLVLGLPAISAAGVLLGKVSVLDARTATISLLTDSDSTIAATFIKNPEIQTVVNGKLGLGLSMALIPQDAAIGQGDLVVSSSLEANTPAGLLIGAVAAVQYYDGDLFKTAQIEPAQSARRLSALLVILPPEKDEAVLPSL